jgi:hypothetical protein
MYICLHVKYRLFLSKFSGQIFEKYPKIRFHENPSSGSRFVPCGRTDTTKQWSLFAILRTHLKIVENLAVVQLVKFSTLYRNLFKGARRCLQLPWIKSSLHPTHFVCPPILLLSFPVLIYRGSFRSAIVDPRTQYPRRFHGVVLSGVMHNVTYFYIKGSLFNSL